MILWIAENYIKWSFLTLIWVGFRGFLLDGEITPTCIKLVRITLETWNLVQTLILPMSAFYGPNSTFTQSNIMRAVLNIL